MKERNIKDIVKISRKNYDILLNGGHVNGYAYDPNVLYLVEDTAEYITNEEIEEMWKDE